MYNLQHYYYWLGVVELMDESVELLGYHGSSSKVIQLALVSRKAAIFNNDQILTRQEHFGLDLELYNFALDLLKYRYIGEA